MQLVHLEPFKLFFSAAFECFGLRPAPRWAVTKLDEAGRAIVLRALANSWIKEYHDELLVTSETTESLWETSWICESNVLCGGAARTVHTHRTFEKTLVAQANKRHLTALVQAKLQEVNANLLHTGVWPIVLWIRSLVGCMRDPHRLRYLLSSELLYQTLPVYKHNICKHAILLCKR